MESYKEMYDRLFNKMSVILEEIQDIQRQKACMKIIQAFCRINEFFCRRGTLGTAFPTGFAVL